jgi:hypothetical protein
MPSTGSHTLLSIKCRRRALSSMNSPSLAADLRTASRILRALLGRIDAVAAKANETAQLLNLRLEVEG